MPSKLKSEDFKMKNYIQPGNTVPLTAPTGGATSGVPLQVGEIVAVATSTVEEGQQVEGHLVGVFNLPKDAPQAWTEGAAVYWDDTAKVVTVTPASNKKIGVAVAPASAAATEGKVRLNGSF